MIPCSISELKPPTFPDERMRLTLRLCEAFAEVVTEQKMDSFSWWIGYWTHIQHSGCQGGIHQRVLLFAPILKLGGG